MLFVNTMYTYDAIDTANHVGMLPVVPFQTLNIFQWISMDKNFLKRKNKKSKLYKKVIYERETFIKEKNMTVRWLLQTFPRRSERKPAR